MALLGHRSVNMSRVVASCFLLVSMSDYELSIYTHMFNMLTAFNCSITSIQQSLDGFIFSFVVVWAFTCQCVLINFHMILILLWIKLSLGFRLSDVEVSRNQSNVTFDFLALQRWFTVQGQDTFPAWNQWRVNMCLITSTLQDKNALKGKVLACAIETTMLEGFVLHSVNDNMIFVPTCTCVASKQKVLLASLKKHLSSNDLHFHILVNSCEYVIYELLLQVHTEIQVHVHGDAYLSVYNIPFLKSL